MKKKNGKRSTILILVLLLLVGLSSAYVASTYAKYTEELTPKNGTAQIAKWAFKSDNETGTVTFALDHTYNSDTLVANKIAPGTEGYFTINLTNENTETGVHYVVNLAFDEMTGTKPNSLKFYKDSNKQVELDEVTDTIEGDLTPNQTTAESVKIYWVWEYQIDGEYVAQDAQDTTIGIAATPITIPVEITGTQKIPQ